MDFVEIYISISDSICVTDYISKRFYFNNIYLFYSFMTKESHSLRQKVTFLCLATFTFCFRLTFGLK